MVERETFPGPLVSKYSEKEIVSSLRKGPGVTMPVLVSLTIVAPLIRDNGEILYYMESDEDKFH